MTEKDRRENQPPSDKELYKTDVDQFIQTERRRDELDRLNEVREQKSIWKKTMLICGGLNALLITLAIIGMMI